MIPSVLVLNGSPKEGFCKDICFQLSNRYINIEVVDTYKLNAQPCIDCTYCTENLCECIFLDLNTVYEQIENADVIIIVTPVHVGSVSAPLLALLSRMQKYFINTIMMKNEFGFKKKVGFGITVSGTDWSSQRESLRTILTHALREVNSDLDYYYYLTNSDKRLNYNDELREIFKELDNYAKKSEFAVI